MYKTLQMLKPNKVQLRKATKVNKQIGIHCVIIMYTY